MSWWLIGQIDGGGEGWKPNLLKACAEVGGEGNLETCKSHYNLETLQRATAAATPHQPPPTIIIAIVIVRPHLAHSFSRSLIIPRRSGRTSIK